MKQCWGIILTLGLLGIPGGLWAQFPGSQRPVGFNPSFSGTPNFNSGVPNQFQSQDFGTDSLAQERPKIKPNTKYIDRRRLFIHQPYQLRQERPLANIHYWDELDRADGFVQSLGQIGKPYQILYHGFEERNFSRQFWYNAAYGRYNRYILNPQEQVLYFDTRTPYVHVDYAQGSRQLQPVRVSVSQNISPLWNVAFQLRRRQATGVYRDFTTDHYNMFASVYFHTRDKRYHVFTNGTFNELSDEVNGGVPRAQSSSYPVVDEIIQENIGLFNQSFFKGNRATSLSDAQLKRIVRGLYVDQYYHLIGENDSVQKPHKLSLRNALYLESSYQRFSDAGINQGILASNLIPVLPTVPTATSITDAFITNRWRILGEASYTLSLQGGFRFHVDGGLSYERLQLRRDSLNLLQNITDQYANGSLSAHWFKAEAKLRQRLSTLFKGERHLDLSLQLYPLPGKVPYRLSGPVDSTKLDLEAQGPSVSATKDEPEAGEPYHPLSLSLDLNIHDRNPTLFQSYFQGRTGNTFQGREDLENQRLSHVLASLRYTPPATIRRGDTLLANYYQLGVFFSRADRFLYYNDSLQVQQAMPDEKLQYLGAEAAFRLRFLRKLYLESRLSWQQGRHSGDQSLHLYARSVPQLFGKTSLYYDSDRIDIADHLRVGVELVYHTAFVGQTLDPISGEYFPTSYQVPAYPRVNLFFAFRTSRTFVWFKLVHANEFFPYQGYYTTPFYPMIERTFTLGVSWTFFD